MEEEPTLLNLIRAGIKDLGMPFKYHKRKKEFLRHKDSGRYIDIKHGADPEWTNLMEYINTLDMEDPEVQDYFRSYARLIASDQESASQGAPTLSAWDNVLFGIMGPYYGQDLGLLAEAQKQRNPEAWIDYETEKHGISHPVNLRDMFLGYKTAEEIGLEETNLRPGGTKDNWDQSRYPFYNSGEKVYDITPFIKLESIQRPMHKDARKQDALNRKWLHRVENLKVGESFKIEPPLYKGSLDTNVMNWSVGKDENGRAYVAIADVWDFGDKGGPMGDLLDRVGKPINMYGRIYLNSLHFQTRPKYLAIEDIYDVEFDMFGRAEFE